MFHVKIHLQKRIRIIVHFHYLLIIQKRESLLSILDTHFAFYWCVLLLPYRDDFVSESIDLYDHIFREVPRLIFKPFIEADIYI